MQIFSSSARSVAQGMRLAMSMASEVALKRGAETASCIDIPQSRTLSSTCRSATPIQAPPGAPKVITGRSSSKTMLGAIEEKRLLPGAIEPARPGRGSYQFMAPLSMKPVPGAITPEGTPLANVMLSLLRGLGLHDLETFGDSTGAFDLRD